MYDKTMNSRKLLSVLIAAMMVITSVAVSTSAVDAATKKAPKSITLKASAKKVDVKGKVTVSVKSVKPAKADKTVIWKSSDKKIATVSKKGVVTGKKKGTVKITAISKVNKKVKKTIKITVKQLKPTKVTISQKTAELIAGGDTLALSAVVKPANVYNKGVKWSSSDEAVATVDKNGVVTPVAKGTAEITVTTKEAGKKAVCTVTVKDPDPDLKAFTDKVDISYSRNLMDQLIALGTNEDLGFRTAGSEAELAAAELLASEMEKIGLQDVTKEPFVTDTFEFKNADLTYNNGTADTKIEMAMYQTTYMADNEEVEIIYAGEGTAKDYERLEKEGVDVKDKIILLDIDQNMYWWINWPAVQAKMKGAKAVISVNVGEDSYCSYSEDTIGVQDFCGPSDAPAFSICVADANPLKAAIEANGGSIKAVLNADSQVKHDGTSYNVSGVIKGKTDEVIYMYAHYDSYFRAFADNTSGVACMMGIAKALAESGYQPERTIKFIAHGAEEWGVDNSRYDWARGAEVEMEMHGAEWIDNAFMAIDIDSGVVNGEAEGVEITVPYELAAWAGELGSSVQGSPFKGEFLTYSPAWTWTEAFSYTVAGIPVIDSGLYGADTTGSYHSSSDTEEANSYDPAVYEYCHKLYGSLAILLDKQPVKQFNYEVLFSEMKATVNDEIITQAVDLTAALDEAATAAAAYKDACAAKTEMDTEFNKAANYVFKDVSNNLFTLDWNEEFQFVHLYKQTNVEALRAAVADLEAGDVASALDWVTAVDLNWYAMAFDLDTYRFHEDQVLGPDAKNSWGEGYLKSNADLWQVVQDLKVAVAAAEAGQEVPDTTASLEALKAELAVQEADLAAVVDKEIQDLKAITDQLNKLSE